MENTDNSSLLICSATCAPGCANQLNLNSTALVDTAANITLVTNEAPSEWATIRTPPKAVL